MADFSVLIRSDCVGAISALRKGSFRSQVLQNVALLHKRLFMDLGAMPPLYLHAPGAVVKAEGVEASPGRQLGLSGHPSRYLPCCAWSLPRRPAV